MNMRFGKILVYLFAFSIVLAPALAQQDLADRAGLTRPNSPFYIVDRVIDRARYRASGFDFIPPSQAEVGLQIARERSAEAGLMRQMGLNRAAEKAEGSLERVRGWERARNRTRERVPDSVQAGWDKVPGGPPWA